MVEIRNMKILMLFLAAISTCSTGVIPRVYYADEHVLNSEFEAENVGKLKDNCMNGMKWKEWKSNRGCNPMINDETHEQDVKDSGTKEEIQRLTDHFHDSSRRIEVSNENKTLAEKVPEIGNGREIREFMRAEFLNQINEPGIPASDPSETLNMNSPKSPEETNLINAKEISASKDGVSDGSNASLLRKIGNDVKEIVTSTEMLKESENSGETKKLFETDFQNTIISKPGILENYQDEILHANLQESPETTNLINPGDILVLNDSVSERYESNLLLLRKIKDEVSEIETSTEIMKESKNSGKTVEVLTDFQNKNISKLGTLENNRDEILHGKSQESTDSNDVTNLEEIFEQIDTISNTSNILDTFNFNNISIQFVTENISSIESLSIDENDLMSQGGEIALFQDESTNGFEFLIDSETTKSLLLTELIDSQNFLETENELSFNVDEPARSGPETLDFVQDNDDVEMNITFEIGNDATASVKDSFNVNDLENILDTGVDQNNVLNSTNAANDVGTVRPISDLPTRAIKCPRPGICIFWFLAQDKCTDSSQCKGSSICCKIRCSKTCIDI